MRGVFITGTSTGVGKTIVAAGLAAALRKRDVNVGVMKPFATASKRYSSKFRSEDTAILARAAGVNDSDEEINPAFYELPAAPLMAAKMTNSSVNMQEVLYALKKLSIKHSFVVVEGIGGIMVPLTEKETVADFAKLAEMPIVIVTHPLLGTMNHTILTVNACRQYGMDIKGIIVNMMPKKPSKVEKATPETIERFTKIPVVATIPFSKSPSYRRTASLLEKLAASLTMH